MNQKLLKINIKNTTKQAGWKFWLWFGMLLLLLMFAIAISMSWLTRHALNNGPLLTESESKMVVSIAIFPTKVRDAILELRQLITEDPISLLYDRKAVEKPTWIRRFPVAEDNGYLLFSGVDSQAKQSVVKLIRIADGEEVVRWKPDFLFINNQITDKQWGHKGSTFNLQAIHPLLLHDASIIFNTGNSLVKQSSCSSKPLWVLDEIAHHSNELDETGKSIWVPSVATDGFPENFWLRSHVRDDALGHFSLEGKLMERRSFSNILINNGLGSLLMGTSGFFRNDDPIHMNQIKVAKYNSTYWKRGDLLISARNISTLFLYRPSTNKILWHQTGPWMNQHSVDFVDDHRISVFSNNVISGPQARENLFLTPNDINRVYFFDFDKNQASQPYEKQLSIAKPITRTAGRAQILPGGGLFVEESESGRHLRFTKDRLLWSRVNDYDDRRIGVLSWSRYLTAEEVRGPLKTLAEKDCQNASKTH